MINKLQFLLLVLALNSCSKNLSQEQINMSYGKNYIIIPANAPIQTEEGVVQFSHKTMWWAEWTRQKWITDQINK